MKGYITVIYKKGFHEGSRAFKELDLARLRFIAKMEKNGFKCTQISN